MKTLYSLSLSVAFLALTAVSFAAEADAKRKEPPSPMPTAGTRCSTARIFEGWKKSDDNPDTFKVVDGEIVVHGKVCHLYYDGPVNDAKVQELRMEVRRAHQAERELGHVLSHQVAEGRLSEAQASKCQVEQLAHAIRSAPAACIRLHDIMNDSPAKDDEWFTQTVIVNGRQITVKVNDKVVNEYTWTRRRNAKEASKRISSAPAPSPCKATIRAAKSTTRTSR